MFSNNSLFSKIWFWIALILVGESVFLHMILNAPPSGLGIGWWISFVATQIGYVFGLTHAWMRV